MKTKFFCLTFLLAALSTHAQLPTFEYITEFKTNGPPLALAADVNGGIYYTVFSFHGPNQTACYYISTLGTAYDLTQHVLVDNASETNVPPGRGFTGVAVDSNGFVYLTLESGSNNTASVRKLSPAPEFKPVEAFFGGIVYGGKRFNGVDIIDDNYLILTTFTTIEFWDVNDSTPLHEVSGGESYQRDVAYNPNTGDIYIAKNRDVNGQPISSANVLSGGNASNIYGYETITPNCIPVGGAGGPFGANGQLIEYDAFYDLILIPYFGETKTLALYDPDDPSSPAIQLDAADSPVGPLESPADSVVTHQFAETKIFVSDHETNRIIVFSDGNINNISSWEIY